MNEHQSYVVDEKLSDRAFISWLKKQPEAIEKMGRQYPSNYLYMLPTTGQHVYIHSYQSNDKVTAVVSSQFNLVMFDFLVFDVDPSDLRASSFCHHQDFVGELIEDQALKRQLQAHLQSLALPQKKLMDQLFKAIKNRVPVLIEQYQTSKDILPS